ncbi:sulfotransferase family protein [Kitasatospora sp. NPDC059673]|uniref:sulfotransferase-like domain-containing protein n=1 Tax=Kitasatospora sp. NPDC059673 TaxID=3346901 RepID=UPI0036AC3DB6
MTEHNGPRLIALWSAPRCRSTAFMRMMAERGDFLVVHEPFSHVADFGAAEVAGRRVGSEAELIALLRELSLEQPVFFKDTTDFRYPGLLADQAFLAEVSHSFILRHPREAIASHFALNPELSRDEIGFALLAEIFDAAVAAGRQPVVVDSDDLLALPERTVEEYCARVGIPFLEQALSWRPGMREEWRRTERWHRSASETSGFQRVAAAYSSTPENHPLLADYLDFHLPYYERLMAHRMTVTP